MLARPRRTAAPRARLCPDAKVEGQRSTCMNAPPNAIETLDRTLRIDGPEAALHVLIQSAEASNDPRLLLDALLLKARYDLKMPLISTSPLSEMTEPDRTQYEDRYVDALRQVGQRLLDRSDILAAWPYFRAIGEKGAIAR